MVLHSGRATAIRDPGLRSACLALIRPSKRTLAVGITLYQGEFAFPWPLISAALIVAIVPICISIALFQERVVGGLTSGGLKG